MSIYQDLTFDQGADWFAYIVQTNPDQTPLNIASYQFSSQFKLSYYTPNVSGNLVCTIVDAANGNLEISLDNANTANIPAGDYVYDVFQTDTSNKKSKLQSGILKVTPSVTGITPDQNSSPVYTGNNNPATYY